MAGDDTWKYERIAEDLRARIKSGEYPPGSQLPTKGELKALHEVSDGPVNEALRVLRSEGYIETRQGSGSFAAKKLPERQLSEFEIVMGRVDDLTEEVRQLREIVEQKMREGEA